MSESLKVIRVCSNCKINLDKPESDVTREFAIYWDGSYFYCNSCIDILYKKNK